jgi:phage-related protein
MKQKKVNKTAYLTKRKLVNASKRATSNASKQAISKVGYIVIATSGWIVKKYADGTIERIKPLPKSKEMILD